MFCLTFTKLPAYLLMYLLFMCMHTCVHTYAYMEVKGWHQVPSSIALSYFLRYLPDQPGPPGSPRDYPVSASPGCAFYVDARSPNSDPHVSPASTLPLHTQHWSKFTFDKQSVGPELVTITNPSRRVRTLFKLSMMGCLHHLRRWGEWKNDVHMPLTA